MSGSNKITVSKKLKQHFELLENEMMSLFHHLDMYKKLQKIVLSNEKLKSMDGTVTSWMQRSFISDLTVRGARLCDKDERTDSLIVFLRNLKNNNSDELRTKIDNDIEVLYGGEECKKLLNYRHQHIAHIAKKKDPLPKIGELFKALEIIEEIMKEYKILLFDTAILQYTPEIQNDWSEVFTIPWIESYKD